MTDARKLTVKAILEKAFAMPLACPSYPRGPYRFIDREFLVITYRTDPEALASVVPEPLEIAEPFVKFEFINMPDSTGFGSYCEAGQVIPVTLDGVHGGYVHAMYLNDHSPIAGGRELWGFPKKLAEPRLTANKDTLVGTLDYYGTTIATGTMGFKHQILDHQQVLAALSVPNFMLKILPHVDGTPRVCELVRYFLTDITLKGAWSGPGALELHPHALAPVAGLPVREVVSAVHFNTDLTLPYGEVVHDYLAI